MLKKSAPGLKNIMKEIDHSILLAICPMTYQGEKVLQDRWPVFLQTLRSLLGLAGGGTAEVMLTSHDTPFSALSTFFESLNSLKKQQWQAEWGAVPLQVILHLHRKKDPPVNFTESSAPIWGGLKQETIYATRALKFQWDQLVAGRKMPAHSFLDVGDGLFQLCFSGDLSGFKRERLFTGRFLAAKGNGPECFYCGMVNHAAAHCPSKQLSMEAQGINRVGYLSFPEIDHLFKRVMVEQKKMANLLAAGVDSAQIRTDPALQVYITYFDMYLIYQPRFLAYTALSSSSFWDGASKSDRIKIDRHRDESRNLQAGFDYLRRGQYEQAVVLLRAESQVSGGKYFYATLVQAFIALECGRMVEMAHLLQMLNTTASTDKEKIYIGLLLARFYRLTNQPWKAEQFLGSLAKLYLDCPEIQYSLIQARVHEGLEQQQIQLLRKLAAGNRRYFMIALMDPAMFPAGNMVDKALSELLDRKNKEAGENLAAAQKVGAELQVWFGEENDEELQTNLTILANLEKQFQRCGVYDLFDVAERAKSLTMACPRLRAAKLEELNLQVDVAAITWADYHAFWQEYPYKSFFRTFEEALVAGKKMFVEARSKAGKNLTNSRALLQAGQAQIKHLKGFVDRMVKLKLAMDTLALFLKKLLMTELVFSGIAFLILPLITLALSGVLDPDIVRLAKDPQTQKGCMIFLTLFLAPFFALTLTLRSMSKR
ncbi:MAG: hypothetical protein A2512_11480 [Deltaproteobacteria bacterium RIFOXYD12_FULL_56_24]|nr:MAG: hypothetical protein A2512_11480 [Deltaproteobacteria bacterium RIFOXYD12_FULL_56_24]